ncbi:TPA: hypothetical protein ACGS9W_004362 [Escherichia coli]
MSINVRPLGANCKHKQAQNKLSDKRHTPDKRLLIRALPQTQFAQIKHLRGVLNNIFYVLFIMNIRKSGLGRGQSSPASIMRMSVEMSAP